MIALLKNNNATLKSTHLCFLNFTRRFLFQSEFTVTRNDDESVKGLFKNHGFSDTQVSKLFNKCPSFLGLNIEIVKPKLDYLCSYGFTSNDLCQILETDGNILGHSLENHIIPSFEFLKTLLKDNVSVIAAVKRSSKVIRVDFSKTVGPNIELLLDHGVPESRILLMLRDRPRNLTQPTENFRAILEEVKELGFHPEKSIFCDAVHLFTSLSKLTRERKWDLFRKWGLSDDEILSAFRRHPFVMITSEKKIERVMDFLVNKMGWNVSQVSYCPHALMHSLENFTMPRCFVVKFLLSKGVLKENLTLGSFINIGKESFRKRFVDKFCVDYPEVINLHERMADNAQKFSTKVTD